MKAMRAGLLIAGALALSACATSGTSRHAQYSEADQVIMGVFKPEEMSCPKYTTMLCTGTGRLNMQCTCEDPHAVASSLSFLSGGYW